MNSRWSRASRRPVVIGRTGGTPIDDMRGGNVRNRYRDIVCRRRSRPGQEAPGAAMGDRGPGDAVRFALCEHRIGGVVSQDPDNANVGLTQLTERVVQDLIAAVGR
jgi:hypothetical protein